MKTPSTSWIWSHTKVLLLLVTLACSGFRSLEAQEKPQDKGGRQILLLVDADPARFDQDIERTKSVLQNRCDQLNINCKLERRNGGEIMLRFSSSIDPARVKNVLLSTGLEIFAVISEPSPVPVRTYPSLKEAMDVAATVNLVLPYKLHDASAASTPEVYVLVNREPIVTGQDVRNAWAVPNRVDGKVFQIIFRFEADAAQRFGDWTGKNIKNYLAVVFNKRVQTIAYIKSAIHDSGEISGDYTREEAEDIARVLRSGNLPARILVVSEEPYKP